MVTGPGASLALSVSDLKSVLSADEVTWLNSGVSALYMTAWRSILACVAGVGIESQLPAGRMSRAMLA